LVDRYQNTRTLLKENTRYVFEVIAGNALTQGEGRFEVQFGKVDAVNNSPQSLQVRVYNRAGVRDAQLKVEIKGAVNNRALIRVLDMQGNRLKEQIGSNGMNNITMNAASGIYIIEVSDSRSKVVEKILK
jgi:hypothetical protein